MKALNPEMKIGLIIPASGTGSRMQTKEKKQFLKIGGQELLQLTIDNICSHYQFSQVVIVCQTEDFEHIKKLMSNITSIDVNTTMVSIVEGGKTRQNSVYNGLKVIHDTITHVMVHDGARPFVSKTSIDKIIEALKEKPNITLGLPAVDSLCEVENYVVKKNIDRSKIYNLQTPQGFKKDIFIQSHNQALADGYKGTDDCSLCQHNGYATHIVEGNEENIKITRPLDIQIANLIYKRKSYLK